MSWPHPLDHEWRPFTGDYFKLHYEVRVNGVVLPGLHWPNGGTIRAGTKCFGPGECEIRISEQHPLGGPQIDANRIKDLIQGYGEPDPDNMVRIKKLLGTFG